MGDVDFSYQILGHKEVEITFKGKTLRFFLNKKRAFTVLISVLEVYPEMLDLHDALDSELGDPNRAHSDLRNEDGFANFLIEGRNERRTMMLTIDLESLFELYSHIDSEEFLNIGPKDLRKSLSSSVQEAIFDKFDGKCNITGSKLYDEEQGKNLFAKSALTANYDHRRPLTKNGSNEFENFQLISKYANQEKNKICNSCEGELCEECALAWPENYDIIICTGQNIKDIFF